MVFGLRSWHFLFVSSFLYLVGLIFFSLIDCEPGQ